MYPAGCHTTSDDFPRRCLLPRVYCWFPSIGQSHHPSLTSLGVVMTWIPDEIVWMMKGSWSITDLQVQFELIIIQPKSGSFMNTRLNSLFGSQCHPKFWTSSCVPKTTVISPPNSSTVFCSSFFSFRQVVIMDQQWVRSNTGLTLNSNKSNRPSKSTETKSKRIEFELFCEILPMTTVQDRGTADFVSSSSDFNPSITSLISIINVFSSQNPRIRTADWVLSNWFLRLSISSCRVWTSPLITPPLPSIIIQTLAKHSLSLTAKLLTDEQTESYKTCKLYQTESAISLISTIRDRLYEICWHQCSPSPVEEPH